MKKHPILLLGLLATLNTFAQTPVPTGYNSILSTPQQLVYNGGNPVAFNPLHLTNPTFPFPLVYSIPYLNALVVGDPNGTTGLPSNVSRLNTLGMWQPFEYSLLQAYGGTVFNQDGSRSGVASIIHQNRIGTAFGALADASYQSHVIGTGATIITNSTFGVHGEHYFDPNITNPGGIFTAGGAFRNNLSNASAGTSAGQLNAGVLGMLANQTGQNASAFNAAVLGTDDTRPFILSTNFDDLNNPGTNYAGGFLGRGYFSNRVGIGLAISASLPGRPSAMLHIDGTGIPGQPETAISDGRILRLVGLKDSVNNRVLVIDDSGYVRTRLWPISDTSSIHICGKPNNVGHSNGIPNTIACGRIWDNSTTPTAGSGNVGINTPEASPFATLTGASTWGFVRTDGRFQMNGINSESDPNKFTYVGILNNGSNEIVKVPAPPVNGSCSWNIQGNGGIIAVSRGTINLAGANCNVNGSPNAKNYLGTQGGNGSQSNDLVFGANGNGWMRLTTNGGLFLTDNETNVNRSSNPFSGNIKIGMFTATSAGSGTGFSISRNIFFGHYTAFNATSGADNILIGNFAGYNDSSLTAQALGTSNIILGQNAAQKINQSNDNVIIGRNASRNMTMAANRNVVIGNDAGGSSVGHLVNNTVDFTGINNVILGNSAGRNLTTGGGNTFVGFSAGQTNTAGQRNTIMGSSAGTVPANTSGNANVVIGDMANAPSASYGNIDLLHNSRNVFIGAVSGTNNVGSGNTFLGFQSGNKNGSGPYIGNDNTFIGNNSGGTNSVPNGNDNVSVGRYSSNGAGYGSNNISLGSLSGAGDNAYSSVDGNNLKDNSISIGFNNAVTGDNAISIGSLAVGDSGITVAGAERSIAIGTRTKATNFNAIAIGSLTSALSTNSIALGRNCLAIGTSGIAVGDSATAGVSGSDHTNNIAIGTKAYANGGSLGSIAIGFNASVGLVRLSITE